MYKHFLVFKIQARALYHPARASGLPALLNSRIGLWNGWRGTHTCAFGLAPGAMCVLYTDPLPSGFSFFPRVPWASTFLSYILFRHPLCFSPTCFSQIYPLLRFLLVFAVVVVVGSSRWTHTAVFFSRGNITSHVMYVARTRDSFRQSFSLARGVFTSHRYVLTRRGIFSFRSLPALLGLPFETERSFCYVQSNNQIFIWTLFIGKFLVDYCLLLFQIILCLFCDICVREAY